MEGISPNSGPTHLPSPLAPTLVFHKQKPANLIVVLRTVPTLHKPVWGWPHRAGGIEPGLFPVDRCERGVRNESKQRHRGSLWSKVLGWSGAVWVGLSG